MAKRRKAKRRRTMNQLSPTLDAQQPAGAMSTSDLGSGDLESSDAASTDPRGSEGVHTEMTSIMDTDPDPEPLELVDLEEPEGQDAVTAAGLLSSELEVDDVNAADDSDVEGTSTYARSQYPRVGAAHRVELPFLSLSRGGLDRDAQTIASTRSLYEQDLDYVEVHGRRYCGTYFMPNDDKEQDRLRLLHQVYLHIFDCQLTSVPLDDPEEILDIGTGTGEWAIGMGELYPDCRVTGIDISAIQDTSVPENVYFEIDNAEDEWERGTDTFDLVHLRNLLGSFKDWSFIYDQAFAHLKPGGWLEVMDFDDQDGFKKFLSVFPPDSELHTLARELAIAAVKAGRARGVAHLDPRLLMAAGFVDIKTTEHIIPINLHDDPRGKAGKIWLAACLTGLEAVCLRPLTTYMGWDGERLKRTCENVANEMKGFAFDKEKSKGLIIKVRTLVGRKPPLPADWTTAASGSVTGGDSTGDDTDATPGTMSLPVEERSLSGVGAAGPTATATSKETAAGAAMNGVINGSFDAKGVVAPYGSTASFALSEMSSTMDADDAFQQSNKEMAEATGKEGDVRMGSVSDETKGENG